MSTVCKFKHTHATKNETEEREKSAQLIQQHNRNKQTTNLFTREHKHINQTKISCRISFIENFVRISGVSQCSQWSFKFIQNRNLFRKEQKQEKHKAKMVEKPEERLLPTNKVRTIMKSCGDPSAFLSKESVLVVTKAAVSFST